MRSWLILCFNHWLRWDKFLRFSARHEPKWVYHCTPEVGMVKVEILYWSDCSKKIKKIIITGYAQAFHSFLLRSFWMKRTRTRLENFPSVLPPRGFLLRCFRSVGAVVALRGRGGFVRRRCRRLPQTSRRRSPGRSGQIRLLGWNLGKLWLKRAEQTKWLRNWILALGFPVAG